MREQRDVSPTRTMVLVLLVGGIVTIPTLFLRGLWSPDEPRYAAIAWQLARSDNPLVPRINDALYAEKPPLFFYLGMAGDVFWPSRGTRMVQAAAALGLALLLAAMGAPAGARARILAPLVFLTAVLGMEAGKFGTIDALLILLLAAAVHMGRIALGRERPLGWWLGTWVLLALANLVKGPVVLPFALLALLGSLADVRCTAPWHRHMLAQAPGLAVFGAIVLAWLLPALSHTCDEYRTQLLGQIWGRVTGERTSHLHPWHYYL